MADNVLVVSVRSHYFASSCGELEESPLVAGVESVQEISTAEELLQTKEYGCAVIDPYLEPFYLRENASPFIGFVRGLSQRGIPVVIASTYNQEEFQRFGFKKGMDYAVFSEDIEELGDIVTRVLQGQGN